MAVHNHPQRHTGFHFLSLRRTGTAAPESADTTTAAATATRAYVFAGLRVLTGFVFLWAFLDKTFGFGYATQSGNGWIDGGSSLTTEFWERFAVLLVLAMGVTCVLAAAFDGLAVRLLRRRAHRPPMRAPHRPTPTEHPAAARC